MLYIITNNHEYHTLQMGLQQVEAMYGDAPGYGWQARTQDPEYLRIHRPKPDFVALAKAFGGMEGEVVAHPEAVRAAVRRGWTTRWPAAPMCWICRPWAWTSRRPRRSRPTPAIATSRGWTASTFRTGMPSATRTTASRPMPVIF